MIHRAVVAVVVMSENMLVFETYTPFDLSWMILGVQ
jgi:hypothetical protein